MTAGTTFRGTAALRLHDAHAANPLDSLATSHRKPGTLTTLYAELHEPRSRRRRGD